MYVQLYTFKYYIVTYLIDNYEVFKVLIPKPTINATIVNPCAAILVRIIY